jgi:hypothetical protein
LKVKLKGGHFDIVEVIEIQLQAVLNTIPEHDLQDACFCRYGTTSA